MGRVSVRRVDRMLLKVWRLYLFRKCHLYLVSTPNFSSHITMPLLLKRKCLSHFNSTSTKRDSETQAETALRPLNVVTSPFDGRSERRVGIQSSKGQWVFI
jgi:hypothetical protein